MDAGNSLQGMQQPEDSALHNQTVHDRHDGSVVQYIARSAEFGLQRLGGISEPRQLLSRLGLFYDNEDYLDTLTKELDNLAQNCTPAQARIEIAEFLKRCIRDKHATTVSALGPAPPITLRPSDFLRFSRLSYGYYREHFTELKPVGSGGFGKVFLCVHNLDGNSYCIKKIRLMGRREEDQARMMKKVLRALREARCLSRMSHPNVIRYYNSWLEFTSPEMEGVSEPAEATPGTRKGHNVASLAKQKEAPVELFTESSESASGLRFESMSFIGDTSSARSDFDIQPTALIKLQPSHAHISHVSSSGFDSGSDFSGSSSEDDDSRDLSDHVASQLVLADSTSTHFDLTLYLQMESCQEFTLSNVLQRMRDHGSQEVPLVDRIQCMCELAEALQHTHLSGIVHRDIKPDNIFFKFPRSVKLADFGLSKESANDPVLDEVLKFSGSGEINGGDSPSLSALSDQELTTSCGTVSYVPFQNAKPFSLRHACLLSDTRPQSSSRGTLQQRMRMCFRLASFLRR
jgi:serine/threonine protein kinase